ncbi:MAG: ABC transporter ATP-binding protein [Sphingobacteriales bacterium]|nr:MAG: ABC transporter ATP-binding protein [Sphingobacteriales bacterium]
MEEAIIKVRDLAKAYRVGLREQKSETLSGALVSWLKSPIKNYTRLRNLSRIDSDSKDDDIHWAVNDVSFDVNRGDVLGIIGRNGAGKSTLLKLLSRITEPTKGSIEIQGRVASLLEVGTGFSPDLTGRENTYLNGTILGMTRKEVDRKFDEIVAFSGVEKFIDTPVKRYSSGMKVRLGFAVAAFLDPDILILDEVLAVGDAEFQKKCLGKMQDVADQQGRTVLFVSHNMTAVQSLCTRAVWLQDGGIAAAGPVTTVVNDYLRLFSTSNLKQSWAINAAPGNDEAKLLSATIHKHEDRETFQPGEAVEMEFQFLNIGINRQARYDITFHLIDEMSNTVFVGTTVFENIEEQINGVFKAKVKIPEHILHEGTYTVGRLIFLRNKGRVVYEHKDVLSFEIINTAQDLGRIGKKEGIIKPRLNWQIQLHND